MVDYVMVLDDNPEEFEDKVLTLLAKEYQPHSQTHIATSGDGTHTVYSVAMAKWKPTEDEYPKGFSQLARVLGISVEEFADMVKKEMEKEDE